MSAPSAQLVSALHGSEARSTRSHARGEKRWRLLAALARHCALAPRHLVRDAWSHAPQPRYSDEYEPIRTFITRR